MLNFWQIISLCTLIDISEVSTAVSENEGNKPVFFLSKELEEKGFDGMFMPRFFRVEIIKWLIEMCCIIIHFFKMKKFPEIFYAISASVLVSFAISSKFKGVLFPNMMNFSFLLSMISSLLYFFYLCCK